MVDDFWDDWDNDDTETIWDNPDMYPQPQDPEEIPNVVTPVLPCRLRGHVSANRHTTLRRGR